MIQSASPREGEVYCFEVLYGMYACVIYFSMEGDG